MSLSVISVILAAYVLGSIPFGLLLTTLGGTGDIRHIGSGNIGATNVLRTGRRGLAAATLLLDACKGALAVCLARTFFTDQVATMMAASGMAVVLGHCFPLWLRFQGGKGVATGMGVLWAFHWPLGLLGTLLWLLGIKISRISSFGALLAFLVTPLAAPFLMTQSAHAAIPLAVDGIALIIWCRHYRNILRLLQGTEPRVGRKG